MRTLTLKADEDCFNQVTQLAKQLNITKSDLLRQSIALFDAKVKKDTLKKQIFMAAKNVEQANKRVVEHFEDTLTDGLGNV